ncbi:LTA synthase family protein [uncultured Gemmiger sp.]|uniref:LTA synthase family protein n=1 Tax=uncultured Gemmiger sp. TaxID=1623490 RepID=UPI0025E0385F|nr:LTA synthase family protein [uncultured Gemmiger sp.]
MANKLQNFFHKSTVIHTVLPLLLALAAAFVGWFQLELSDAVPAAYLAAQWPVYAPLNALTALCVTLLLYALTGRWSRATGLSGAAITVLALVNYYTRDLHGSAVMPEDVLNLSTAAEVMGSYTLQITGTVVAIVLLYLPVLLAAWLQARLCADLPKRAAPKARAARYAGCAAGIFAILYAGYFAPFAPLPRSDAGWTWQTAYYRHGFLASSVETCRLLGDAVIQPAGYDESALPDIAAAERPNAETDDRPDILLILSESLYDFSLVTDLQADAELMPVINALPNAVRGHTVSANVGGGTNVTEYEMLTSNSPMLVPTVTPFNGLDFSDANSVVGYLKSLGYTTMAAHPYAASNYNRDVVWQQLGFDETHFMQDFPTQETYGARPYQTDSATYRDWQTLYEAMPADKPRFSFLVSIQTHGDYTMNDDTQNLVHAATDYGAFDHTMDEYLSCVQMSDAAFGELCEYFTDLYARTGRKVIVAMAGDHAPSFVAHVSDPALGQGSELTLLQRSTPFVIWANYPLPHADAAQNPADPLNRMDMVMLTPTLLEQAGLPLSDYYRYLLTLKDAAPVVTGTQDYTLPDGTAAAFGEDAARDALVRGYFDLEYNNIGTRANRVQTIFEP